MTPIDAYATRCVKCRQVDRGPLACFEKRGLQRGGDTEFEAFLGTSLLEAL